MRGGKLHMFSALSIAVNVCSSGNTDKVLALTIIVCTCGLDKQTSCLHSRQGGDLQTLYLKDGNKVNIPLTIYFIKNYNVKYFKKIISKRYLSRVKSTFTRQIYLRNKTFLESCNMKYQNWSSKNIKGRTLSTKVLL